MADPSRLNRFRRRIIVRLLIIPVAAVGVLYWVNVSAPRPKNLGLFQGRLYPLPTAPNCVSSQTVDDNKRMPPWKIRGDSAACWDQVIQMVETFPRVTTIEKGTHYAYFEFRSWGLGLIDDVEFLRDDGAGLIHFRAVSRLESLDLGTNRRRMSELTQRFEQLTAPE